MRHSPRSGTGLVTSRTCHKLGVHLHTCVSARHNVQKVFPEVKHTCRQQVSFQDISVSLHFKHDDRLKHISDRPV